MICNIFYPILLFMKKLMTVKKRSGEIEKFDADKINKVLEWACTGIHDTSFEEVAMNANLSFFDGISSKDIQLLCLYYKYHIQISSCYACIINIL